MYSYNEMVYRNEINTNSLFNVSMEDFREFLIIEGLEDDFRNEIQAIETDNDRYSIAVDYSIPYSMVKEFEIIFRAFEYES